MLIIFFIFVLTPVIEIALFIQLGGYLGMIPTIALVVLTATAGVTLLRWQGMATLLRAKSRMEEGQMPAEEMVEGILLAIAGAFLLTPGFFTDTIGFLLLFPMVRHWAFNALKGRMTIMGMQQRPRNSEHTFEGEYTHESETKTPQSNLPPK